MKVTSTRASIERGEVSALAVVETIAASAASVYIAAHFETLLMLLVGATLAPLLLLRTERSTAAGLRAFEKVTPAIDPSILFAVIPPVAALAGVLFGGYFTWSNWDLLWQTGRLTSPFVPPYIVFIASLGAFAAVAISATVAYLLAISGGLITIKLAATAYGVVTDFRGSLVAIPRNWHRVALCTDITTAPELFPGLSGIRQLQQRYGLANYFADVRTQAGGAAEEGDDLFSSTWFRLPWILVMLLLIVVSSAAIIGLLYLPALLYRWSLKSTTVIYLPFAYLSELAFTDARASSYFEQASRQRLSVLFAAVVVITHVLVPIIVVGFFGYIDLRASDPDLRVALLRHFSFYPFVRLVTLTKIANAALVFFTLWVAKRAAPDSGTTSRWETPLRALFLIRAVLTSYSIFILLYTVAHFVTWADVARMMDFYREVVSNMEFDLSLVPRFES